MRYSPRFVFGVLSVLALASCGVSGPQANLQASSVSSEMVVEVGTESSSSKSAASSAAFNPATLLAYTDTCTKAVTRANAIERYEDAPNGYSVGLPFNEKWGSAPYVLIDGVLHFGPPVYSKKPDGDCAAESAFTLKVLPKRGADEARQAILADYESHAMPTPDDGWGVNLLMVDRRVAVQWGIGEWVCPMPALEIPGTVSNVQLSVSCYYPKSPLEAQEDLEEIMRGMEFVE